MELEDQDYGEDAGSGVMVSNLPLLFSRGNPSSLHNMTLGELEVFVPFVVQCSLGEDHPLPWAQLNKPTWWPKKLPFRMPSSKDPNLARSALVGLVERCYSFHGCEYLLQFCASLVAQMPPSGYRFNDNRDGTTSMYHGTTGKLLVTFRNENREYDQFSQEWRGRESSTKRLLLSAGAGSSSGGDHHRRGSSNGTVPPAAMFQPRAIDIYLCDKCENEFYSLQEVQSHERQCCGDTPCSQVTPSPESEPPEDEVEPAGQVPFLSYFNLRPAKHTGLEPYMSPRKRSTTSPPRQLHGPIYPRYESIALSSPLGRFIFANSKCRNRYQPTQYAVMRYERHLHATPNTDVNYRERCNSRWIVMWRLRKEEQQWVHLYCFTRAERQERLLTISTGLNSRSRELLRECRPMVVKLKRLKKRLVDRLIRLGEPSSAPCIDLTQESQLEGNVLRPAGLTNPSARLISLAQCSQQQLLSGQTTLQWLPGIQPVRSSVPSSSITASAALTPVGVTPTSIHQQHNSLVIPYTPVRTPQHSTQPLILHSALMGRTQADKLPTLSLCNSNALNTTPMGNSMVPLAKSTALPADTLLIPLTSVQQASVKQLEKDIMKPLSKKKYFICNNQPVVQQRLLPEEKQSVASPSNPAFGMYTPTKKTSHNNKSSYSSLVPPPAQPTDSFLPLSDAQLSRTSSSIEIIDLSSDEDEGRGRERQEADNAPQQLDGLACYPHTGAKVPNSSQCSFSKNGNSHWSSQKKSRCGTGRGGDLATNGQPPSVLPSTVTSPVLCSAPATPTPGPHTRGNSRKRKQDLSSSVDGSGKMLVLDINNGGYKLKSCHAGARSVLDAGTREPTYQAEKLPVVSEGFHTPQAFYGKGPQATVPITSATITPQLHTLGSITTGQGSSTKQSLVVDEDITFNWKKICGSSTTPEKTSAEVVLTNSSDTSPNQDSSPTRSSFLSNIVSKSVNLLKYFIGGGSQQDLAESSVEDKEVAVGGSNVPSPTMGGRRKRTELILLQSDECRELHRTGLDHLNRLHTKNMRLTRRSLESFDLRRARRKARREEKRAKAAAISDSVRREKMSAVTGEVPQKVKMAAALLSSIVTPCTMNEYGKSSSSAPARESKDENQRLPSDERVLEKAKKKTSEQIPCSCQ